MPSAKMIFFKRCAEFRSRELLNQIPNNTRGIYALFKQNGPKYDAIYIGMSRGEKMGVKGRLKAHLKSSRKSSEWTHFSIYEVHDNITSREVEELEGEP